ncbi:MAG: flagellar export protein FliJ [Spirochaetia bacterium]|nr:flagellar export protein FliJ [Spirochaetia bacterium]
MRKFQFNLEKILELRKYDEQQWEIKLGQAIGRCTALKKKIEERRSSRKRTFNQRHLDTGDMRMFMYVENYTHRMDQEITELRAELEQAEKERKDVQEKFLEVSKKRKILDKLKERKQQMYYKKQEKQEQKVLDDISSAQYARKLEDVG